MRLASFLTFAAPLTIAVVAVAPFALAQETDAEISEAMVRDLFAEIPAAATVDTANVDMRVVRVCAWWETG